MGSLPGESTQILDASSGLAEMILGVRHNRTVDAIAMLIYRSEPLACGHF